MKSIKGLSFYNSEGSLIDVEELYAQVQQLEQDSAAKIIIGETASTTSTTSSDIDELAGTETDISLTNADEFKAGDMGISIVTVTDRNNSHGFMVFLALADEPDQPAGTLHVRFITGIYNGKDGIDGQGATIAVGEVTTGAAGTQASVTNSGTANAAVLDFTIPKGADGTNGVGVPAGGTTGQVLKKKSGADYDAEWANESGGGSGAKVVDIGQISLNFMETGDASVNITNEQYDALEEAGGTILKFSTSDGQDIYLNCFCLGNGIIYSAMIAESGIVAAYTASIGGSSQKTVAIRASAVYGSTEGNIATVIDIGTVANFSIAEEGNWTVNISDEMYSEITAPSQETTQIKIADASGNVAYLTRYVDNDGSLIFASTYTDASQATLIQLFADVRGSEGNYKIEIACTMSLLGPHPQFIDIGVVQGFEFGVEGAWSVNISDTIYNKIAEGEDVRLVISDTNTASVIMPQVQTIQGKKQFGTSILLDQNGGRIEYAAGTSGVPGDYRLEIVAIVPDVGGGGGVEIVDLGTPTFQEANGGRYLLANLTLTSEQAAKLKAEPAPVVKFTLSGANGDYQNGAYYLTKTNLIGVDGHVYNTCFQVQDNGGWAITLQTVGTLSAIITIYPYYIPQVEANPSENTGVTLEKLKVGNTIYAIPQGGGAEIVDLGALTFSAGKSGAQASGRITQEQYNTLSASGTSPIIKFTDNTNEVLCQRTGSLVSERDHITYYTYAANTNTAIPAQIASYSVTIFGQGSLYGMTAYRVTIKPGEDGASGVTDVTAGTPTEQDGYTVTPVTFNFEQGNSKTVNVKAKNGEGAGVQQNAIINRTANLPAASTSSPDFVESGGDLWVKKTEYIAAAKDLQTSLPFGHEYGSAVTLLNGKIYLIGGGSRDVEGRDAIVEFNPDTQVATVLEATLSERWYSTAAASQGKIYVFGGSVSGSPTADIIEFDPLTQTVTTLEVTLPSARTGASAATASNGVIYVFGGETDHDSGDWFLDEIIRFEPVNKTVTTLDATLPNAIRDAAIASANNGREFYMFGGVSSAGGALSSITADIIRFDTVTQTATKLKTTLPSRRNGSSAATAPNGNGKIYVFGGTLGSYIDDIVEFDPVNKTVTTLDAALPSGRAFAPAATASNGMIYVFGGVQGGGKPDFDDIVEFDVYANSTFAYRKIIIANSSGTVTAPSFNTTT